jgi:hypothetical protein
MPAYQSVERVLLAQAVQDVRRRLYAEADGLPGFDALGPDDVTQLLALSHNQLGCIVVLASYRVQARPAGGTPEERTRLVMETLAAHIEGLIRGGDLVVGLPPDGLVVIAPAAGAVGTRAVIHRAERALQGRILELGALVVEVSLRLGASWCGDDDRGPHDLEALVASARSRAEAVH